jgi:hypothetical protein
MSMGRHTKWSEKQWRRWIQNRRGDLYDEHDAYFHPKYGQ